MRLAKRERKAYEACMGKRAETLPGGLRDGRHMDRVIFTGREITLGLMFAWGGGAGTTCGGGASAMVIGTRFVSSVRGKGGGRKEEGGRVAEA